MSSSREYLDMDNSKSSSSIKFKAKNGFFVERWAALGLILFFIASLVAVGLLVYYFSPRQSPSAVQVADCSSAAAVPRDSLITEKPYVMLPKSLKPLHYTLELKPFLPPEGNFSFAGKVTIQIACDQGSRNITLHARNLTIHETTVKVKDASDGNPVTVESFSYDTVRQFFIIHLKKELVAKTTYNVSMGFLGLLNDDMTGFYRSSYNDSNGNVKWLAVTQFQPTDARQAFPCFDEPSLKASFDITLVRPANMTSLSNMPINHTEDRENNFKADVYQTTLAMSTYLLAFVVADFEFRAADASNTQFRVWARPSAISQVDYALAAGPKTLDFFQGYFNVSFPLPKQDMIAVPDFRAGAMENWGLITYRETALLWDPKTSSSANKQRVLTVIVHELAHQWFGNLVTPKWWDDLWLNEGFASYMEYVGSQHVEPDWNMGDQILTDDVFLVLELDSLESSHPVSVPVNNPDEINEIFDRISYSKGAAIIRMMQHFLSESVFRKGLTSYLTSLSYKNAVQDDLWQHLSDAAKREGTVINVKEVMDTWTLQTGYPLVRVERDYTKQTVKLTQKRFFLTGKSKNSNGGAEKWHIPITFTTAKEKNFTSTSPKLWFNKMNDSVILDATKGIPSKNEWVIFNIKESAYYRTTYDDENWKLIIKQLQTDFAAIDTANRAQLLDDALDLARAGELDYNIALNITTFLNNDFGFFSWDTALNNFAFIDRMLRYTPAYGVWKKYILKKLIPVYERLGFDDLASNTHLDRLNRVNIVSWACKLDHPDCIAKSVALYAEWMKDPTVEKISPNLKRVVSCAAIRAGGEREWAFAFDRYLKSNVGAEKDMLLSAMTCTEELWILGKYLDMLLDPSAGVRKADAATVFVGIASLPAGRFLAFNFLRDKWEKIMKMHGSGFFVISSMVKAVTASLNSPFDLQELKDFVYKHHADLATASRSFQQAVEETEANVEWMERSYNTVSAWLQAQP